MSARTLRVRLVLVCALSAEAGDRKTLASLPPEARDTAATALQWTDQYWDSRAGVLWDTHMDPQGPCGCYSSLTEVSPSRGQRWSNDFHVVLFEERFR
jgi:hypothetical protein